MRYRTLLALLLILLYGQQTISQVNLQNGSAEFSFPIINYKDNISGVALNMSISYSSRNGVLVDEIPSCVGEGWNIDGAGIISRITRGEPDDQFESNGGMHDMNKYPPGYLFNTKPTSSGCPNLLMNYPTFEDQYVLYKDNNLTTADREQDIFIFNFNGHSGKFVIDKSGHVIALNDTRLIITPEINFTPGARTLISKFTIIDEYGCKYEFAQKELSRTYDYYPDIYHYTTLFMKNMAHEIPLNYLPYVVKSWYLTKISDPRSGRSILLNYKVDEINMDGPWDIQYKYTSGHNSKTTNNIVQRRNEVITQPRISIKKPELANIIFPDNSVIDFEYGQGRYDCQGSSKLNSITTRNLYGERISKIQLSQKYFIKNTIIEADASNAKWGRLCLLSIEQYGKTDLDKTNPYKFNYYVGENATENFVPPVYFHAKDPWGYFNGDYCGVDVSIIMDEYNLSSSSYPHLQSNAKRLALFNSPEINSQFPGGYENACNPYIISNTKTGYAKNGLLKEIENPYGGRLTYFYEQNSSGEFCFTSPHYSIDNNIFGGVHVSKLVIQESASAQPNTTTYEYVNEDGTSSIWGVEYPCNVRESIEEYYAEGKYFTIFGCKFHYQYAGQSFIQLAPNSTFGSLLKLYSSVYKVVQVISVVQQIFRIFRNPHLLSYIYGNAVIIQYLISLVESCQDQYEKCTSFIHYNAALNFANALPMQFKRVVVSNSSGTRGNGKTVYEFTSPDDFPLLGPKNYFPYTNKLRSYNWVYGLQKSCKIYNNSDQLVKSVENNFHLIENKFTAENTLSCNCTPAYSRSKRWDEWNNEVNVFSVNNVSGDGRLFMQVEFYNQSAGRVELTNTTEKIYTNNGEFITHREYEYNPANFSISAVKVRDSKGTLIETKTYYPEDYNLNTQQILQELVNNNIVNVPVSEEKWQTKTGQTPEMIGASITEFGLVSGNKYKPVRIYGLQTDRPVPENFIGSFDPNQLVRNPSGQDIIIPTSEITYDPYLGEPIQVKDPHGNKVSSTIFGTSARVPIAIVTNAGKDEIAYCSFEQDGGLFSGNWNYTGGQIIREPSPTGKYCYQLGSINTNTNTSKEYRLSFWATTNHFALNNNLAALISAPIINGWTYYEFVIPAGTQYVGINATGNCKIDELRIYPKNANMTTTTYEPGIGKTSECDINNHITYYEYDGLGRISKILDEHRNVIKTYEYHFKN